MEKKEQVTKDRLQKLIKAMEERDYYNSVNITRVKERVRELQERGVCGVDKFVQKLLERVNDKDACWDILTEGRFAIVLARNNFVNVQIEYAEREPDIEAVWNRNTVYFEVTRRHSGVDEWAEQAEDNMPSPDEPEDVISRIQGKLKQLKNGEINIVVFWSATGAVQKPDMKEAFEYIQEEINQNPGTYKGLSGVVFTEDEASSIPTMEQYYLFKNANASKPIGPRLARRLESLNTRNPKQLRNERERWSAILKKKK